MLPNTIRSILTPLVATSIGLWLGSSALGGWIVAQGQAPAHATDGGATATTIGAIIGGLGGLVTSLAAITAKVIEAQKLRDQNADLREENDQLRAALWIDRRWIMAAHHAFKKPLPPGFGERPFDPKLPDHGTGDYPVMAPHPAQPGGPDDGPA